MSDNFDELGRTLKAITSGLSPSNQAKIKKKIGNNVAKSNRKRIKANIDPDGNAFTPRAKKKLFEPNTTIRFLYPHSNGDARAVELTNWTVVNNVFTGHDKYSNGQLKSFSRKKIIKFLPSSGQSGGITKDVIKKLHAQTIKSKMFKALSSTKFLKERYNSDSIEIGFFGKGARVATEHHYGEMAIISKFNNKRVQMPQRRLLGIGKNDEIDAIEEASKLINL